MSSPAEQVDADDRVVLDSRAMLTRPVGRRADLRKLRMAGW
jgi:hypothetical protein